MLGLLLICLRPELAAAVWSRLASELGYAVPSVLSQFRIGSVPYLNAVPLTARIEASIALLPPAELSRRLADGRLDAALVSSTEVLFSDRLRALEGYGIVSRGPVYSVFLAHREPLEKLRTVHLDPASCTSVNLLRALLDRRGIRPEFKSLSDYSHASDCDNVLLIGNPAIEFRRTFHDHQIWDLGDAWQEFAGLPFTYALWAFRDDFDPAPLAAVLHSEAVAGLQRIPQWVQQRSEFDLEFRRQYVGGHIQYRLDVAAKVGLERFATLLKQSASRPVYPIRWIPEPVLEGPDGPSFDAG